MSARGYVRAEPDPTAKHPGQAAVFSKRRFWALINGEAQWTATEVAIVADLLGLDDLGPEPPFWCYPCSRGEHSGCSGMAWQPDVPCECGHQTGTTS